MSILSIEMRILKCVVLTKCRSKIIIVSFSVQCTLNKYHRNKNMRHKQDKRIVPSCKIFIMGHLSNLCLFKKQISLFKLQFANSVSGGIC